MLIRIIMKNIIEKLGGIKTINKDASTNEEIIAFVKKTMGCLPENVVIDFSMLYGNSVFNKQVVIESIHQSRFLSDGIVEIGLIFGMGTYKYNVEQIIRMYYVDEQIKSKFYPICEGYPGDIIYYSLEEGSFGQILYWHHESVEGQDTFLISNSFNEFLEGLYVKRNKEIDIPIVTDDELAKINERRKKVGLPLIDKNKKIIR